MASDANPFSLLFPSRDDLAKASEISRQQRAKVSDVLVRVFLFTGDVTGIKIQSMH